MPDPKYAQNMRKEQAPREECFFMGVIFERPPTSMNVSEQ
jgi:hypothetical protein